MPGNLLEALSDRRKKRFKISVQKPQNCDLGQQKLQIGDSGQDTPDSSHREGLKDHHAGKALKVVEVKASPRGSPHCMRRDDTIAVNVLLKNRKVHLKIPPASERGNQDFPSELLPTQRDFQQQQQRTTSCRQLYRGTAQLECPAQPLLQRVVVRNVPLSSPGVGQRRGGVSMAVFWNTRAML